MRRTGANNRGFNVIGAVVAAFILGIGLMMTLQLFSNTNTSYRRVITGEAFLWLDDDFKIAVTAAMKAYYLRALSNPPSPSADCQAKPAFFTNPAGASAASLSLLNGISLTLLSTTQRSALDSASTDVSVREACGQTNAPAYCGSGTAVDPWVSTLIASNDTMDRSIRDYSAFCFCTRLTVTTSSAQTSQLDQALQLAPVYVWFRWRERYAKDGLTKTCSQVRALNDNPGQVNILEYKLFFPSPNKTGFTYKISPNVYMTGGLQ